MLDYIRIACAVPKVVVGDPMKNAQDICHWLAKADEAGADLVVFPELAITGYTCADLFYQDSLLRGSMKALQQIVDFSRDYPGVTAFVGLPALINGQMYNCGAAVSGGKVHGLVPKTFLPNYKEFYERRWFSSSEDLHEKNISAARLGLSGEDIIPVGRDLLFRVGDGTLVGMEICEDLWTPMPPSTMQTLNGAEVVVNLSASNETVSKRDYRRKLVRHQSSICNCVYAYASSGYTESTQDLVFSGHSLICECGMLLAENAQQIATDYMLVHDADLGRIRSDRRKNKSIRDAVSIYGKVEPMRTVDCQSRALRSDGTMYQVNRLPFVPGTQSDRMERCRSIFAIQVAGLRQRLATLGAKAVIGVSGGLDSTLALLVAVEAMKELGRPSTDVHAITLPCFGTSDRTHRNSLALMSALGVTQKEVNIGAAVQQHFADIGHDPQNHDTTYENAQARERTQVLMDYAGECGGIVVGTGDLSELALGWCTYNGDHMSMYGVNASVPKTLIRWMIRTLADSPEFAIAREVLLDILDTPISPELLPPDAQGKIAQNTEDLVGPYELHDFFLYHAVRYDFAPAKIYTMACRAFAGTYTPETIKKWLHSFYRRFFAQQFKRSCMPEGVKVGSISLSPRGDWRMPSDASAQLWLAEVDAL